MSDDLEGVLPESPTEPEPAPAPVSAVPDDQGDDRPVKNIVAEFNRKHAAQQKQLDAILQYLQTASRPQPVAAPVPAESPAQGRVLSDEELWGAAQQGDRNAFDLYQQRIADRRITEQLTANNRAQLVINQLQALMAKYPVLNNPSHPLTQVVNQAYQLYLQQGYPATQATLLEAAKTAIADRPDIVSELHTATASAREQSRRSATQSAQAGVTGVGHRQESNMPSAKVKTVTPAELALARRMGVKGDPAKAKERFLKRQEDGTSRLGAVAGYVNQEDL